MKILLSFLQDLTLEPHPVPGYRFWSYYLRNGIAEAGMQWREVPGVDWAAGLVPAEGDPLLDSWKARAWERTLNYVKANLEDIDLFLCYLYPKQIDIMAIKEIRALGLPCINFYCDNVREFSRPPAEFAVFDLIWVPEFEALPMYKKAKIKHLHLPMPVWVPPAYRDLPVHENGKIAFIGSRDLLREQLLAEVISRNLEVEIRGEGWRNAAGPRLTGTPPGYREKVRNQLKLLSKAGLKTFLIHNLNRWEKGNTLSVPEQYIFDKPDFEAYIALSRNSNILLGINRVPYFKKFGQRSAVYSRLRDLEAPMLGACYLTEYTEGLKGLYDLGREIETYRDVDELIAKCRELGSSPSRRAALRKNGQERALKTHAIPGSLRKIMQVLFKAEAGI